MQGSSTPLSPALLAISMYNYVPNPSSSTTLSQSGSIHSMVSSTGPNSTAGSQRSGNSDNLSFHSLASVSQPGTVPSQEGGFSPSVLLSFCSSLLLSCPALPCPVLSHKITLTHSPSSPLSIPPPPLSLLRFLLRE